MPAGLEVSIPRLTDSDCPEGASFCTTSGLLAASPILWNCPSQQGAGVCLHSVCLEEANVSGDFLLSGKQQQNLEKWRFSWDSSGFGPHLLLRLLRVSFLWKGFLGHWQPYAHWRDNDSSTWVILVLLSCFEGTYQMAKEEGGRQMVIKRVLEKWIFVEVWRGR